MSYPPSMVHKSGNQLVVRSVVSGHKLYGSGDDDDDDDEVENDSQRFNNDVESCNTTSKLVSNDSEPTVPAEENLPQCKVKRNYACSTCNYYTQNPRFYLHHLKDEHNEKIRIYECPQCLYASKHSQKLQRHIHMVHVMGKRKQLIKSKFSLASAKDAGKKSAVSSNNYNSSTQDGDDRSETRSSRSRKKTHDATISAPAEPSLFKCSVCTFTNRNANLVTNHERTVHLKKKFYRCTKCDYITHMKARYTKHVKYHSMPMIKCDMCDFRTPYKWNLDRHNKNHFANGAFKCAQCNFTADIKQSLTVHEMNHHMPAGNGTNMVVPMKRRCRVGASDVLNQEEQNQHNEQKTRPSMLKDLDPETELPCVEENSSSSPVVESVNDFDEDMELLRMEREQTMDYSPLSLRICDSDDEIEREKNSHSDDESNVGEENAVVSDIGNEGVDDGHNDVDNFQIITNEDTYEECTPSNLNTEEVLSERISNKTEDKVLRKRRKNKKLKIRLRQSQNDMTSHISRVHDLQSSSSTSSTNTENNLRKNSADSSIVTPTDSQCKKKTHSRPLPNLIPIQGGEDSVSNQGKSSNEINYPITSSALVNRIKPLFTKVASHSITKIPEFEYDKPISEKDLNDIYSRPCANSSLKDFASLIGTDESAVKSDKFRDFLSKMFPSNEGNAGENESLDSVEGSVSGVKNQENKFDDTQVSSNATNILIESDCTNNNKKEKSHQDTATFKKKNASFFDRLKEKLIVDGSNSHDLNCRWCGHKSKCLSESILHQKTHSENVNDKNDKNNGPTISGAELSSTRCQHCRQRCKTSSDLLVHLQTCAEMIRNTEKLPLTVNTKFMVEDIKEEYHSPTEMYTEVEPEKEENKVFVWNNFSREKDDDFPEEESRSKSPASESSLIGYEIAPGIGSVMPSSNSDNPNGTLKDLNIDIHNTETTTKKVFKCPTCTFWASTASRFHVHIVSHMNVKPFGCSVCPYQSKWKWDVTKHIKLKKERDPVHEKAEMRAIDVETGRRNYTKYNPYLTLMRVHEPRPEFLGNCSLSKTLSPKLSSPKSLLNKLISTSKTIKSDTYETVESSGFGKGTKRSYTDTGMDQNELAKKKSPNERKVWKCKKCKFKNTEKSVVLAHVRGHYSKRTNKIVDSCSENTTKSNDLEDKIKHVDESGFKCCFCEYFVDDKQLMLKHISSHGVNNPEETLSNSVDIDQEMKDEQLSERKNSFVNDHSLNEFSDNNMNKTESLAADDFESNKRFKCCSCPYVTNNKSQYLYHKQFHKLRGAQFKCNVCSYNVTKRHLLHQHLKIHGIQREQYQNCVKDFIEDEPIEKVSGNLTLTGDIDTIHLADIPQVWVHKSGNLNKMFKCRHCPHVNLRKSNIHEHEKMHFDRVQRSPNGSVSANQVSTHHCNECNYVCNNAGALASHSKVHQGTFGQICAIVDSKLSDESQITEIEKLLKARNGRSRESNIMEDNENVSTEQCAQITHEKELVEEKQIMYFCGFCPSRFLCHKDMESHIRFHNATHSFKCTYCTYSAPQQAQLMAHKRVHTDDYQVKTNALVSKHHISNNFGRPQITVVQPTDKNDNVAVSQVYVVTHNQHRRKDEVIHVKSTPLKSPKVVTKQFSCHKCPARFFKSIALKHHLTLHGGKDQFQCRACDYRVKTYGNLIKHEAVHNLEPRIKAKATKKKRYDFEPTSSKMLQSSDKFPLSGTELFEHRNDQINNQIIKEKQMSTRNSVLQTTSNASFFNGLHVDPEFGLLMHGSPDFIYPTTVKNGKLKEKRYKCHKCPSAFEKREQYKTHVSLHGAKSRFQCQKCDYSVKYFANYTQHMRKHEVNDKCQMERKGSSQSNDESADTCNTTLAQSMNDTTELENAIKDEIVASSPAKTKIVHSPSDKITNHILPANTLHISVANGQAIVLMQQNLSEFGFNVVDSIHRCTHCPFSHMSKNIVEAHQQYHFSPKDTFKCEYCNYTVPNETLLQEHLKAHLVVMKSTNPGAYMKCNKLKIWIETEEGKVLIFKDGGEKETRLEPPVIKRENVMKHPNRTSSSELSSMTTSNNIDNNVDEDDDMAEELLDLVDECNETETTDCIDIKSEMEDDGVNNTDVELDEENYVTEDEASPESDQSTKDSDVNKQDSIIDTENSKEDSIIDTENSKDNDISNINRKFISTKTTLSDDSDSEDSDSSTSSSSSSGSGSESSCSSSDTSEDVEKVEKNTTIVNSKSKGDERDS